MKHCLVISTLALMGLFAQPLYGASVPASVPTVKATPVAVVPAPALVAPVKVVTTAPAIVPAPVAAPKPTLTPVPVSDPTKTPTPVPVVVSGDTVTVGGVVTSSAELLSAVKAYKAAATSQNSLAKRIALLLGLAALIKILISTLKLTSDWWKTNFAKNMIRVLTIVMGMIVYFVSTLAGGQSWQDALLLGLSGPMAISINELVDAVSQWINGVPVVLEASKKVKASTTAS